MPNSIADNLTRLQNAKTAIGNAITAQGGTVGAGDGLEEFATAIGTIPAGSDDSGHFIKEALPITFNGDGNNLSDYVIYGKQGGLNGVCPNIYPPIDDNSINRGSWGLWYDYDWYLPDVPAYFRPNPWQGMGNEIHLDVGTYTFSVYAKAEYNLSNAAALYVMEMSNYPHYSEAATLSVSSKTIPTLTQTYQRYSFTFEVTAAGYVCPRVEKTDDSGTGIIVTCYQLEKGSSASPYVAYNTSGITINVNGSNIFFPRSTPLGPDDTLTMADTGVNISTINGVNTISTPIVGGFDMKIKGGISSLVLGTKLITADGTYNASDDNLSGYSSVTVKDSTNYVTREINFVNNTKAITEGSIAAVSTFRQMSRCNVADDGTINAYYGDANYTEDGSNGQVMVYVPKFYYKLDVSASGDLEGVNIRHGKWSIADGPKFGYKLHPAFLAADGVTELDYFLYGAFEAVGQDSNGVYSSDYNTAEYKLGSVGGNTYKPIRNLTRATARTMATNRGTGWYQIGIKQTMAIQMLFAIEYGFNSQAAVGYGVTSDSDTHNTGQTVGNTTSGTRNNYTTSVNYRGIENIWGNLWNWVDGININDHVPYICDSYSFEDDTATGYTQIGFTMSSVVGWVTAFGYDANNDYTFLPSETTTTTIPSGAVGDYYGAGGGGWCIYPIGGSWVDNEYVGLFDIGAGNTSATSAKYFGTRLMYIPTVST